ncbi:UTP--glucose-1-phosphate uridylyltransferase family [Neocallimastix lanati (nom. inval.)]|jgi:UTP--glucose-1-phosphate uridylyltransferase|uniref:UTP--glucose-1-phosphate uridylyltransferase n=1 Tax=Neocallimastix californiae TaxID=1754190 RepID=A0A1Y2ELS8_9FUNG|nr:UTP--glucose-1-phosphate uridylyltransferase family [Neocallimastix sp. JGI-2020a]ORY72468.1 UTP--glucose-1-phosphate uridylyltransferase [Neocallimastix californiae]|eukprot:ORY72468.1 UTP--glucose-1-phosphate uridylyltransferase [Neocallimastix californiae]
MSMPGTPYNGGPFERIRSLSVTGFEANTISVASKQLRIELDKLASMISNDEKRAAFENEMDNFYALFKRYLQEKTSTKKLDWDLIKSPSSDEIVPYKNLVKCSEAKEKEILNKLAVLKLNGGLGTTMGCVGPKSAIEVRDNMTFLDLTVRQIEYLNEQNGVNVPFILMNSFNTDEETKRIVQKYTGHNVNILTFNQSRFPRINKDSLLPLARDPEGKLSHWYPPGHGDLFESLYNSGVLDRLIADGKEYIFISNVDNLGATVDTTILNHMIETDAEFIMEVTDKTRADVKGGTLIDYNGQVRLLEIAQVPSEHVDEFKSVKKFKIFNTNNLWISLKALKRVMENHELNLDLIVNNKTLDSGEKVIQLETAVGAAIKHFKKSHGVNVPRKRFLPVKSTSDLFLVTSDLYKLQHGELIMNPQRMFNTVPLVKLGDHFKKVGNFLSRFQKPPHILELDHLTVTGDVTFGRDVQLRGTVIIVANSGCRIDIPSGAILENKVVSGNLRILDH